MRSILGKLIIISSWIGGAYVGIWLMFIQPIIYVCQAFDAGTLTGAIVGMAILKCIFSGVVGSGIAYIGTLIGAIIEDE